MMVYMIYLYLDWVKCWLCGAIRIETVYLFCIGKIL